MISASSGRADRIRCRRSICVGGGAQWKSSSTSTARRPRVTASTAKRTASKNTSRSVSGFPLGRRVQLGEARDQVGRRSQRVHERLVGNRQALVAAAVEHEALGVVHRAGELRRQPCLADPRLSRHQHEPRTAHPQPVEALHLGLASDERRAGRDAQRWRQVARERALLSPDALLRAGEQRRIPREDRVLERAEPLTRLDPQVLAQGRPRVAIRVQRVRLAIAAVEREHLLGAEAFPIPDARRSARPAAPRPRRRDRVRASSR